MDIINFPALVDDNRVVQFSDLVPSTDYVIVGKFIPNATGRARNGTQYKEVIISVADLLAGGGGGGAGWQLTGNVTAGPAQFLGTTNADDLRIRVGNLPIAQFELATQALVMTSPNLIPEVILRRAGGPDVAIGRNVTNDFYVRSGAAYWIAIKGPNGIVGIGTTSPDPSAQVDISSTTAGFLAPRMTTAQKFAIIAPATGLLVYDTTLTKFYYWDGVAWIAFQTGGTETLAQVMTAGRNVDITGQINTFAGVKAIDVNRHQLFNAPGAALSIDWAIRNLYSSLGLVDPTINYNGRALYGAASSYALTWFANTHVRIGGSTDNGYQLEVTGNANVGFSDFDPAGSVFSAGSGNIRATFGGSIFASFGVGAFYLYDEQFVQQISIESANRLMKNPAGVSVLDWTGINASIEVIGDLRTANPGAGQGNWKLGQVQPVAGVIVDVTQIIEVMIDGVLRKVVIAV